MAQIHLRQVQSSDFLAVHHYGLLGNSAIAKSLALPDDEAIQLDRHGGLCALTMTIKFSLKNIPQ
jgi:hypothetical protein